MVKLCLSSPAGGASSLLLAAAASILISGCMQLPAAPADETDARLVAAVELCPRPEEVEEKICPVWNSPKALIQSGNPESCFGAECGEFVLKLTETTTDKLGNEIQRCTATLPYSGLTFKHKDEVQDTNRTVTWVLKQAPKGYKFDSVAKDGGGIRLSTPTGDTKTPDYIWEVKTATDDVYALRVHTYEKSRKARFCHYPRVRDGGGRLCCPLDPMIINEPG